MPTKQKYLVELYHKLDKHFDQSELRGLAFQLNIDFDNLPGESKMDKARELVQYLERRNRISELVALCLEQRPSVNWPSPEATHDTEEKTDPLSGKKSGSVKPPAPTPGWRNWGDHPFVVIVSVMAALITIIVFITGVQNPRSLFPTSISPSPTSPPISRIESIPLSAPNSPNRLHPSLTWYQGNPQNSYELLQNPSCLKIIASPQTDMRANENSAPLVIYPYRGDFEAYVQIVAAPNQAFQFAGMGVRSVQPQNMWLRIGRQSNGPTEPLVTAGSNALSPQLGDALSYPKTTIYLKIRRNGNLFTLSYSDNKTEWNNLEKDYFAQMSDQVEILLIALSNASNSLVAEFYDFAVYKR
jgi:regulation of enolase protein 1 (concanavalin A-like superfamily)